MLRHLVGLLALLLCALLSLDARAQWQWQQLTVPTTLPNARNAAAVAWDPVEARALLFGGLDASGLRGDLWQWDPETHAWGEILPGIAGPWPAPRAYARLVFDPLRDVFWLFGGENGISGAPGRFDDLWRFDPATRGWSRVIPPVGAPWPTARSGQVMVWAAERGSVLMQGGHQGVSALSDVWEWDGKAFIELVPDLPSDPAPAVTLHVSWWESSPRRLVVFGGESAAGPTDQMMAFDPVSNLWSTLTPAARPVGREDAAVVPSPGKVILLGGRTAAGTLLDDLWEWDQGLLTWTELTLGVAGRPPGRAGMGAVLTRGRQLQALTGIVDGGSGAGVPSDSVMAWDWSTTGAPIFSLLLPQAWGPISRRDASLAHDTALGRFVLFGGESAFGIAPARVWLLDMNPPAAVWSDLPVRSVSVPARTEATMVALERSDRILLFGGRASSGNTGMADTWVWEGATRTFQEVAIGTGPPARFAAAMAYEQASEDAILFGGFAAGAPAGDTWRFLSGANTWMQVFPTQLPPARRDAVMATLPGAGTFLFGGLGTTGDLFDGWILSSCDCDWLPAPMTTTPPGPISGSMALSAWHHELVYFGGTIVSPFIPYDQTYTYDRNNWTRRLPALAPTPRASAAMAGGPGGVLLFGGIDTTLSRELWWGSAPTPDPVAIDGMGPLAGRQVCPPASVQVEIEVVDANGRQVLDSGKNALALAVSSTLDPGNLIVASDLQNATALPATTQTGQLTGGRAIFSIRGVVPGTGTFIATAAGLANPDLTMPITLLPGPIAADVSLLAASPDPAVASVDLLSVTYTPRDACSNLLGPGRRVTLASDRGSMSSVIDIGNGLYGATLTTGASDCGSAGATITATVDGVPGGSKTVALTCPSTAVDPASPVTSPVDVRACARQGIFAEVVVIPKDSSGAPLPPGRSVQIDENPPFLVAGLVRETIDPAGTSVYRIEIGSDRCGAAPVPVPIRVDGVLLSTVPQVLFGCEPVDPATIALLEATVAVPADGATPVEVRVAARDSCGNPAFGRTARLDPIGSGVTLAVKPSPGQSEDRVDDPLDGSVAFEVRSAEAGTFDLRATFDGRSAILEDAVTFLSTGGLQITYRSDVARGVAGQVVELELSLTNGYDVALNEVEVRPVSEGLKILSVRDAIELGEEAFAVGGLPVGSSATVRFSGLLRPGFAEVNSRIDVRFVLRSNGLAGRSRSKPLTIFVSTGERGGCACGADPARGQAGLPVAALAFEVVFAALGAVARRRGHA